MYCDLYFGGGLEQALEAVNHIDVVLRIDAQEPLLGLRREVVEQQLAGLQDGLKRHGRPCGANGVPHLRPHLVDEIALQPGGQHGDCGLDVARREVVDGQREFSGREREIDVVLVADRQGDEVLNGVL